MLFKSCFVSSFLQHALCFGALRLMRRVLNNVYVFPAFGLIGSCLNGRSDGNLLPHILRGILGPRKNFFQFSLLFFCVIDWDQGGEFVSFLDFLKFL